VAGLARIDDATGTVDGVNRIFYTPNPYVAGTLVVMINGRQRDDALDNGWIERDPATGKFEMKIAPQAAGPTADDPGDLVSAYYENANEQAGGGADGGRPEISSAEDMHPCICAVEEMAPKIANVDDGDDIKPATIGAELVAPAICAAVDMKPKIAKAEVS
jgi:hypothetical protein